MPRPRVLLTIALLLSALAGGLLAGCAAPESAGRGSSASAASSRTTTSPSSEATTSGAASSSAAPSSSSAAPATGPEARAEAVLAGLDRRERVLQLFVIGVPLTGLDAGAPLAAQGVGGLFLSGRSQASSAELARTTGQWRAAAAGRGLWIGCDQEGGLVQTLKGPGFPILPRAVDQGRLPAGQLATLADGLGASLASAGINLDLAPVADIVPAGTEAGNAPIGAFGRQYGATAARVVPAARSVVDGLAAHRVTAALKHFPGLGRVRGNTDTTASVVDTVTAPGDEQVTAFGTLARSPAHPFVMVSSATYARIDSAQPAAFSSKVITGLLRDQLGFDGVVISDDLGNADAVAFEPPGQRAVRFIGAGGTLVLTVNPALLPEMVSAVLAREASDRAFRADVDRAARTSLIAKARAGLLR